MNVKFRRALLVGVVSVQAIAIVGLYSNKLETKLACDEHVAVSRRHYDNIVEAYKDADAKYKEVLEENEQLRIEVQELQAELERFVTPVQYDTAAAPIYDIPLSEDLQQYTYDMCRYYGIEEHYELILAMMWQESNFECNAISETDDYGLMQINKVNHAFLQETLGVVDIMDPEQNIESGIYFISDLLRECETTHQALMCYNMGQRGAREQWRRGNYTSVYSTEILTKLELLKENKYGTV